MPGKTMKIRVTKAGGHFEITFWTGMVGYTFANIGTLRMDESDMWLLLEVLSDDERVISVERDDLSCLDAHCAHCNAAARLDELGTTCRSCGRGIIVTQTTNDAEPEEGE